MTNNYCTILVSFWRAVKHCMCLLFKPETFWRPVKHCVCLLFKPETFNEQNQDENKGEERDLPAIVVRRAFICSFLLVLVSGAVGYILGVFLGRCFIYSSPAWIESLQIIGAGTLLWGTLFVRGWEIQTRGGFTLVEKVNQWIFRFLYCVGTAIIIFSLAWPQRPTTIHTMCKQDSSQSTQLSVNH